MSDGSGLTIRKRSKTLAVPKSWSPDGNFLVYALIKPGKGADLMAIPVNSDRKPFPVVQSNATDEQGQFSPDSHWLAYTSNESGHAEIYVIPFRLTPGTKWLVSQGGGAQPRWNRNGKELFYISTDSKMMSVEVTTRPIFQRTLKRAATFCPIVVEVRFAGHQSFCATSSSKPGAAWSFEPTTPHALSTAQAQLLKMPIVFSMMKQPSALTLYPLFGLEQVQHVQTHLIGENGSQCRELAGGDASLHWPFGVFRNMFRDKPITTDFSYRYGWLSHPEPTTNCHNVPSGTRP